MATTAAARIRLAIAATVALLIAGTLVHARYGYFHGDLSGHARGSDDAYISYRYSRQLVSGNGLVFNPGERVEGYSNLGYVLLLAPLLSVLPDRGVYSASLIVNLLCSAAAVAVLAAGIRRRWGSLAAAAGAALVAAHPAMWLWTASGMETPLVLLLQVALFVEARGEDADARWRLPVLAALLCVARADGFVGAFLVALGLLAEGRRCAGLRTGAATLATTLVLMAARLAYYGHPLPNTYYAKVSGPLAERVRDALDQLCDVALQAGMLPCLILLALAVAATLHVRRPSLDAVFGVGWLAYWIYVGGDVFGERFLLVLVPLGALILARLSSTWRTGAALAAWGLAAVMQLAPLVADRRFRYASGEKYDRWVELGALLGRPEHRGKTLAIDAAGKVPFLSGLHTLDMLGLTDAHIGHLPAPSFRVGHSKHDVDYVLSRRPDLVATWADEDLNLRWGLDRARYEAEGYRVRWLAYTRRTPPAGEPAIVDLATHGEEAGARVRRGWSYAVLERAASGRTGTAGSHR